MPAHRVEQLLAIARVPDAHDLAERLFIKPVLLRSCFLYGPVRDTPRVCCSRIDRDVVAAVEIGTRQAGAQVQTPLVIAVVVLGIGGIESFRYIEAESEPCTPGARLRESNEFVLPLGFFLAAAILAAARYIAVQVVQGKAETRRRIEGHIEVDRAANVAANRAGKRIESYRCRTETPPFERTTDCPDKHADADQREQQADEREVIRFSRHLLVQQKRQRCRDQVPERGERPGTPHRVFRTRVDRRRLPFVIQQPRRVPVLG